MSEKEWKNEPDRKELEVQGYPVVIIRHTNGAGHLCGYVGLPKDHPCFGKGYDDIGVNVHGGLTYARNHLDGRDDEDIWWVGFDCAHAGDIMPNHPNITGGTYKTMLFVENECRELAEQLHDLPERPTNADE